MQHDVQNEGGGGGKRLFEQCSKKLQIWRKLAPLGQDVLHQAGSLPLDHHLKILLAKTKVAKVLHSKVSLAGPPFSLAIYK